MCWNIKIAVTLQRPAIDSTFQGQILSDFSVNSADATERFELVFFLNGSCAGPEDILSDEVWAYPQNKLTFILQLSYCLSYALT